MKLRAHFWRRPVFTPLEERLLEELRQNLSPEAAQLLSEQVRRLNLAQRHSKGREVNYYPIRGGKPAREDSIRFPATQQELKLATIRFTSAGHGSFTAEFHLVEGYFFSIEFTPSPEKIENVENLAIESVEVHQDPNIQPSPAEPVRRVSDIEATLPHDYVAMTAAGETPEVSGVATLGIRDVYPVVLEEATYYALATVSDAGVLAVKKGATDGVVYFLPYDGPRRALGTSLRDAIASCEQWLREA